MGYHTPQIFTNNTDACTYLFIARKNIQYKILSQIKSLRLKNILKIKKSRLCVIRPIK